MSLTKVLKKILSIVVICTFMLQQTGFVFAAEYVDNWDDLQDGLATIPDQYIVETGFDELEANDHPDGTLFVTDDGNSMRGDKLIQNEDHDVLISVDDTVTNFAVGNDLEGTIMNYGTMTYTGSSISGGDIAGGGTFIFDNNANITNSNPIEQSTVQITENVTLTENATITATTVNNAGTLNNNAAITAAITNTGTLTSSATNLNGAVTNNNALTLEGGETQAAIDGTGATTVTADLTSGHAITQGSVTVNDGVSFDNNAALTAAVTNAGTLTSSATNLKGAVTNNNALTLEGGETQAAIDGTGATTVTADLTSNYAITQDGGVTVNSGVSFNNNAALTAAVANEGTLTSTATNLKGAVDNDGTLNLAGGETQEAITGTGTTNITADLIGNHTITQDGGLRVTNNATFTNNVLLATATTVDAGSTLETDPDNLDEDVANDGTVKLNADGTLAKNIDGNGLTRVDADVEVDDAATITQDTIKVGTGASLTANADNLIAATEIFNDGTLNLTDGTNNNTINGDGETVFSEDETGEVTNNAAITQTSILNKGTLYNNGFLLAAITNEADATLETDPDNLGGDVANEGELNFTDKGTLSVNVTGAGVTNIGYDLTNSGSINQTNINVGTEAIVTTNASDFNATAPTSGIANAGVIIYTGGTNTSDVIGDGRVDITGYVTNNADITQDTVTNSGVFTNNGGVVADNFKNTNEIAGTGSITAGAGISSNSGTIAQATLTNEGTFDNSGHITLTDALTNNGTFNTNADLIAADGGIVNEVIFNITGGTNTNEITGTGDTHFTGDATNQATITQASVFNSANLTNNNTITADVENSGTLISSASNIAGDVTNTGTYNITGGTNANLIYGTGATNILGDVVNDNNGSTTHGFIQQNYLNIATSGSLTTDSDKLIAAIDNAGKLVWNAGTGNENVITGTGELDITGGDIENTNSITQGAIKITDGSLSSNAELLATTNGITNNVDGIGLILTGGNNTNAISGTGDLQIAGNVTNLTTIAQDEVYVDGGAKLTTNADLLTTTTGVTNTGTLEITGGTNANIIGGAGATTFTGDVTNKATINQAGGISNSANLTNEALITGTVTNSGTLTSDAANISGAITNTGSYVITGGDNANTIDGNGTTTIQGNTTNTGSITQDHVNIANGAEFITSSDDVTAAINNAGDMEWTGGSANANVVTGDGALTISGGDIVNTAAITQGNISISGGSLSSSADLLASTNGITNTAALELTGGTNTNVISGTGALTIGGDVANQSTIEQATITVDGGKLTTAADALTTTGGITLTNDTDAISFTSGDNLNEISGDGTVFIDGTVQGLAAVSTDIQVNTGAHYGTDQAIVANLENRGVTDLIDSDITSTGKIKGTGTLNILGDTTNSGSISQSNVSIQAGGKLTTDSTKVEAAIANEGDLEWTAGDANSNVISGAGNLTISGGDIANTAAITQGNISISGGSLTSNADLLASTAGIANDATLGLTGGTNTNVITGNGTTDFTNDVVNEAVITQATVTNAGNLTNNADITAAFTNDGGVVINGATITGAVTNSGTFITEGTDVVGAIANTGSYVITDGDNANDISGVGGALSIQGSTTNTGVIDQDTLDIANGATFVATDMDDISAGNGISNAGTFEMQAGTNNNVISGNTGTLNVTGAVTNGATATITQDTVNIATLGEFTVEDIDDVTTVNGISSTGTLILKGEGTNTNNISGTGAVEVDATGDIVNQGTIEQNSLDNAGVFESNASLLAFANGISNTNELNLTGGTNENVISGAGTTNFTNDVINNAAITQDTVTNAAGTLTNNAAITGDFTNDSGTVNNEAAITGAITNNSGTINSTATNLVGTVTSDGTLNIAGGEVQDAIDGIGTMNITDDLINAQTIAQDTVNNSANMTNSGAITVTTEFNNSGVVDNTAAITGPITNSGTINSTATNLVGAIDNDGTLNMDGGDVQADITGTGDMNITADLTNSFAIAQANVVNEANLTNDGTITADDIDNSGVITGAAADLVANNAINNSGSLVFDAASTGDSVITGTGDVQVTADTTLTAANDYTGGTLIDGADLTVAGQNNIGTGDVKFANDGYLVVTDAGELANGLLGNAATDNVNIENADALSLTGTIGAAADFHKAGAGDMTFTMASNAYTGNTYVDEGKLIGNTGNINNVVNGAAGTTVQFNDTTDAELNEINTLGTFVQSGSAVLNVKNNAFTAAQADINAGTFAANRALTATAMNVNNGATLRGNGNITGTVNVNNGGTIAPGNSIDTLTITGDLNLANGSTTAIEINETPASDKLVVSGNTNIASGANLTVSNENGRYFEWKRFDIIESGAVSGEFTYDGTVTDYDASRIDVEVDYSDPTKVALVAKRKATDYADGAAPALAGGDLSRNQHEVAKAIDAVSTGFGGDITNALLQLEQLGGLNPQNVTLINPGSNFKSALNDMSGVLYANGALTTLFNAKTAHVYDRIAKRDPSAGSCPTCHDNVWVEYYNQYDKVYADENSPHFTNNMSGMLVGYDRSSDELLLGVYTGYGKNDLRQHGGNLDIEDTTLGVYAGWRPGDWVFKGTLSGGYQSYEGDRSIAFMGRTAHGAYKGWNLALDLEGAYNWAVADWVNIKPFVGVLNSYAYQQSFTETGADALNLHVESRNQFNSQARLGVKFDGKVKNRLSWYTSAAVKQFIGDDYAKLHTSLGLPGTRMDLISAELGRTYFSGQVGLNYALNNNWSLFGNVDLGLNNKSTNCYGNLGVAYTW